MFASAACAPLQESTVDDVAIDDPAIEALPARALTLADVRARARRASPELAFQRRALAITNAEAQAAGVWPDPTITLGVAQPIAAGSDTTGGALGIDWDIADVVTAGSAKKTAALAAEAAQLSYEYAEHSLATDAVVQAVRQSALARASVIAEDARSAAEALAAASLDAQTRGDVTLEDVALRQLAALDAEALASDIAQRLDETRVQLRQLLGAPPGVHIDVLDDVGAVDSYAAAASPLPSPSPSATAGADVAALVARARNRGDLAALRVAYRSQDAALWRAVLAQLPRVGIHAEVGRDTGGFFAVAGDISVSLPIFDGGRGAVAVAQATRDSLRDEYRARMHAARADLEGLVVAAQNVRRQRAELAARLPLLERADLDMQQALARGDVTRFVATELQAAVRAARIHLIELELAERETALAIELAVGGPS